MNFLLIAFGLTLIAMLAILFAVMRKSSADNGHADRIRRNIRLYTQRVAELDEDLKAEYIDQGEYQRQYADLSRQLIATVEQLEQAPSNTVARRRWLFWFVPLPLAAFAVYAAIGAYPDWKITQQLGELNSAKNAEAFQAQLKSVNDAMLERLQDRPEQLEYRLMVARFAMNNGNYTEAASHYRILAELLPEDPDAQAFYAQAEYLRANRQITPLVAQLLDKAMQLDPYQSTALGLIGIHAFESGDLPGAIEAWEKLLSVLPPNSDRATLIRNGIEEAKSRLAASGQGQEDIATAQQTTEQAATEGIEVAVTLGDKVPDLNVDTTVFVYAKAAQGPPMPLAVQKLKLKDLPAKITLNESMAMMPNMSLANFEEVIVGARISRSGNPVPQTGDWQGESQPINWRKQGDVSITIDQAVSR